MSTDTPTPPDTSAQAVEDWLEFLSEVAGESDGSAVGGTRMVYRTQLADIATLLRALSSQLEAAITLIASHNHDCQARCGFGDQEAVRCQYRPYFVNNGRRCTTCPAYEMLEIPDVLRAAIDAAIASAGGKA